MRYFTAILHRVKFKKTAFAIKETADISHEEIEKLYNNLGSVNLFGDKASAIFAAEEKLQANNELEGFSRSMPSARKSLLGEVASFFATDENVKPAAIVFEVDVPDINNGSILECLKEKKYRNNQGEVFTVQTIHLDPLHKRELLKFISGSIEPTRHTTLNDEHTSRIQL